MTPRGLAYWYMDDGTCSRKSGDYQAYKLSTQGFTYDDQLILQEALKRQFNLDFNIHKDKTYFLLGLRAKDRVAFLSLIPFGPQSGRAYMHPYFNYKL